MTRDEFISRAESFADENNMLDGADSVLVGFSGGADSTALLFTMREICGRRGMRLYALHVNHMIRGEEADRDEEHCREVCGEYGIEFSAVRINIPLIAQRDGLGTEEAARRERYAAFESYCSENNISRIAVAHNSGDNMETVIFNLIRGSGIKGLCGIPPVRGKIIRPLLSVSKDDILKFLGELGLDYVTDSTNAQNEYTRNYIRSEICTRLKTLVPSAESNISRSSAIMRRENEILDQLAAEGDERLLPRKIMADYASYCGGSLEAIHVNAAVELVRTGELWSSVSLPGSVRLRVTRSGYEFCHDEREHERARSAVPDSSRNYVVDKAILTGEVMKIDFGGDGKIFLTKNTGENKNIYKLSICHTLKSDKIKGNIRIRMRSEGDVIFQGGHRKSVKKLLCEKKVPPEDRGRIPFICDDEGILWIPGVAIRDGVSAKNGDDLIMIWNREGDGTV